MNHNYHYEGSIVRSHVMQLAQTAAEYLRKEDAETRKEFFENLNELLNNNELNSVQFCVAHEIARYLEKQTKQTQLYFIQYLKDLLENKDEEE